MLQALSPGAGMVPAAIQDDDVGFKRKKHLRLIRKVGGAVANNVVHGWIVVACDRKSRPLSFGYRVGDTKVLVKSSDGRPERTGDFLELARFQTIEIEAIHF